MQKTLNPDRIFQTALGFWPAKVVLSAVELDLFSSLTRTGPQTREQMAATHKLHPRGVADFLDALVAMKLLSRDDHGRYSNSDESAAYLDRASPDYMGGILEMAGKRLYRYWDRLTDALRSGLPQNESKDSAGNAFDAIYSDPQRVKQFAQAMSGLSRQTGRVLADKLPWPRYKSVVDVGAAEGALPAELLKAHPHLTGVGFDLPQLKPVFEAYANETGLSTRLKFVGGDMFKDPLPQADVMVLGHILHDWGLERKRTILATAYRALAKNGVLVVYDAMIDDARRENVFGLLMSLNMLIETSEGFDYTPAQCREWMSEAGFKEVRTEPLAGAESMCVGVKI